MQNELTHDTSKTFLTHHVIRSLRRGVQEGSGRLEGGSSLEGGSGPEGEVWPQGVIQDGGRGSSLEEV